MRTWQAVVRGRFNDQATLDVAAPTFCAAMRRVKLAARRKHGWKRIRFVSLVQTANLDA